MGVDRSDLGRRITERRKLLGLSPEDVARRSGVSVSYLDYLETSSAPSPGEATVERLAHALATSSSELRGSLSSLGSEPAVLQQLSKDECLTCIAGGGVGRFVFLDGRGPVAVPVNFAVEGEDIIFRTQAGSNLALRTGQFRTSFEVDHLDPVTHEGWSVLVSGQANAVTDAAERRALLALGAEPWAGGQRRAVYRLKPVEVTGRRVIRAGIPPR